MKWYNSDTRDILSSITTYEKNLAGFERIRLKPGETKEVTSRSTASTSNY